MAFPQRRTIGRPLSNHRNTAGEKRRLGRAGKPSWHGGGIFPAPEKLAEGCELLSTCSDLIPEQGTERHAIGP